VKRSISCGYNARLVWDTGRDDPTERLAGGSVSRTNQKAQKRKVGTRARDIVAMQYERDVNAGPCASELRPMIPLFGGPAYGGRKNSDPADAPSEMQISEDTDLTIPRLPSRCSAPRAGCTSPIPGTSVAGIDLDVGMRASAT